MNNKTTYKEAGVDIDSGAKLVDIIKPLVQKTHRPEVLSSLGGYAGLFALDLKKYKEPVLVSTTDGVGTKLKIAFDLNKFDTIGVDLVAMCVNDLICCGAEPLYFLDYFATGKLKVNQAASVIKGIALALKEVNCTLLGGETAEMPGFYAEGEFDLAGFAVGVVDKTKIIDGKQIESGHKILGLESAGLHSNGYSLARKIISKSKLDLNKSYKGFSRPLGEELLAPTRLYVKPVLELAKKHTLAGLAHITGGGLLENVPRIIPSALKAVIEKEKINIPPLFSLLQEAGNVADDEMWRVFNRGVGFVIIIPEAEEKEVLEKLKTLGYAANIIGSIQKRANQDKGIQLV